MKNHKITKAMFDENAVRATANTLDITIAEVTDALVVAEQYKRQFSKLKDTRKKQKEAAEILRHIKEMRDDGWCTCAEEGVDIEHNSEVVDYIEYIPWWNSGITEKDPVYKCRHCGRKWQVEIAIA